MSAAAFEEAPVYEVTTGLAAEERVNVTLLGQSLLDPVLPGWPTAQTRECIERRRVLLASGRARECYLAREWPVR